MSTNVDDDFHVNAFALLPPSAARGLNDGCNVAALVACVADSRVSTQPPSNDDKAPESPLDSVEYLQRNHNELRASIQALYKTVGAYEQDNGALRDECARATRELERTTAARDQTTSELIDQLRSRDAEILKMQAALRESERSHQALQIQVDDLTGKIAEKDAVISTLQSAVQDCTSKRNGNDTTSMEREVHQLVEIWSAKENAVAANTNHMRQNLSAIQRLGEQLQLQMKQVQVELTAAETEHAFFRDVLRNSDGNKPVIPASTSANTSSNNSNKPAEPDTVLTLENKTIELESANKTLRVKCVELEAHVNHLVTEIAEIRDREVIQRALVLKYEASARDGTETIAELHESLVRLCEQLTEERKANHDRLSKQIEDGMEKESLLKAEVTIAEDNVAKIKCDLEILQAELADEKRVCRTCRNASATSSPVVEDGSHRTTDHSSGVRQHQEQQVIVPNERASIPTTETSVTDQPADDFSLDDDTEPVEPPAKKKKLVGGNVGACRVCNEEAFGFMVRCQKCKDPFHAGCVKNDGSGTRKRLGHIFKCTQCAPQRPTKVGREKPDSSGSVQPTLPLQVLPSRASTGNRKERS